MLQGESENQCNGDSGSVPSQNDSGGEGAGHSEACQMSLPNLEKAQLSMAQGWIEVAWGVPTRITSEESYPLLWEYAAHANFVPLARRSCGVLESSKLPLGRNKTT